MRFALSFRTPWQVLVAPRSAFAALQRQPTLGAPLLLIGALAATLLFVQSLFLHPALQEPWTPGFPESPGASAAWLTWLRLWMVLAAPLGLALRAASLGALLHALQSAAGGSGGWKSCVALAIHLETVYLVESACTLVLLALVRPQSFETLQALHLRSGLDLFWEPTSPFLQSLASALNVFVLWWGALLAAGMAQITGLSRRRAVLLTLPLWLGALALRVLLQPH